MRKPINCALRLALVALATACAPPETPVAGPPAIPELELMEKPVAHLLEQNRARVLADPLNHDAWGQCGAGFHAHLLFEEALACFERAHELDAAQFPYPYFAAIASERLGRSPAECSVWYETAAQLKPDYAPVHVRLGESLLQNGEEDRARAAFEKALELSSDYGAAHRGLGLLLLGRGEAAAAAKQLEIALRKAPDDRPTNVALARAYGLLGENERVATISAEVPGLVKTLDYLDPYANGVAALRTTAATCRDTALRLMKTNRHKEAIPFLRTALEGDPDNAWSHERLGRCYEVTGSPDLARKRFERAIELAPEEPRQRVSLARALATNGENAAALEQLSVVLSNDPNHGNALDLTARLYAGAKDFERAIAVYEAVPRPADLGAESQIIWGTHLVSLKRLEEAARHFEIAVRLAPESAQAHYSLGMTYENLGRLPEAIAEFEKGAKLEPNHPGAEHLRQLRAKR